MTRYRGWIPTVAGKLSFRIIGDSSHPTDCISANCLVGDHRYVLCYQGRNLSDAVVRGIARLRALYGDFRFAFIGRVRQDIRYINTPLFGHVYIFRDRHHWRHTVEPMVRDSQAFLFRYQQQLLEQHYIEYNVVNSVKTAMGRLEAECDVSARITLLRTGKISLYDLKFRSEDLSDLSDDLKVYANVSLMDIVASQSPTRNSC